MELSDRILSDLDKGNTPLAIYLDLSKAFDTLNHSILLKKLQIYGADKTSLAWFKNYLSNRHHYVEIENVKSNLVTLDLGVPQGSILGPLLFIIYVNDIYHSSDFFNFILYADDTSLYNSLFHVRNVTSDDINRELQKIYSWLCINKLSLNISKSKYMIFHHSRRKIEQNTLNLKLHNTEIERVTSFKFLGIVFDENMTWKYHISMITKSISRSVGILCKLKHYVPIYVLKILYNSLIVAHINYGLLVWGYNNKQIVLLQKKAVRIITNNKYISQTEPIFKTLECLKLEDIFKLNVLKFYFKYVHKEIPKYFYSFNLKTRSETHGYNIRNKDLLSSVRTKTKLAENCLRYLIPKVINETESIIIEKIQTHSLQGFISYIKLRYIQKYQMDCLIPNCYVCEKA